jgi:hypothetical protein
MALDETWVFEHGDEHAPDSPTGLKRLEVAPDGRFRFENRQGGELRAVRTGRIAASAIDEVVAYLDTAGFPDVPDHPRPPGANYMTIASGGSSATVSVSGVKNLAGWGPLVRRVVPWLGYLVRVEGPAPAEIALDPPKSG